MSVAYLVSYRIGIIRWPVPFASDRLSVGSPIRSDTIGVAHRCGSDSNSIERKTAGW